MTPVDSGINSNSHGVSPTAAAILADPFPRGINGGKSSSSVSSKLRPRPGTADNPVVVDQVPHAAKVIGQSPKGVALHRAGCRGGHRRTTADRVLLISQQLLDGGTGEITIGNPSGLSSVTVGPGEQFVTAPVGRHAGYRPGGRMRCATSLLERIAIISASSLELQHRSLFWACLSRREVLSSHRINCWVATFSGIGTSIEFICRKRVL